MARRKNPPTEFTELWDAARGQLDRKALASSLDMSQGRLNDLILGRSRPTLGETARINDRRRATRIYYQLDDDSVRSFYTGRGVSLRESMRMQQFRAIIEEMREGSRPGTGYGRILAARNEAPIPGSRATIYPLSPRLRDEFREKRANPYGNAKLYRPQ